MLRGLSIALVLFALMGCQPASPTVEPHEDLDAALWVSTSAEYRAITEAAYRVASEKLTLAIADPTWSALPGQQDALQNSSDSDPLPLAVIIVDETVLNNIPFQTRMIESAKVYRPQDWHDWVDEAAATLVPGARDFIADCMEKGVTIFFVTNRRAEVERGTRRNLEALEIVAPGASDTILSKYERDEWTSDKTTRRQFVSSRYRVLLLIGDDLNDFIWVDVSPTAEARCEAAESHRQWWGHKWFMIPNPNYGGWERALYGFDDELPRADVLRKKEAALPDTVTSAPVPATQGGS